MDDAGKRKALGDFIKTQRTQLASAELNLSGSSRRRTPGLRREEVAQLCGISVTWYTWIEQGRTVSVSTAALARIADALHLSRAKRAYLFELSGKKDPQSRDTAGQEIPDEILAITANIKTPAYLLDRHWNAVAWNRAAKTLFVGWLDQKTGSKNLLEYTYSTPSAAILISDWEQRARRLVAEFRADCGMYLDEPQIADLVTRLSANSATFKRAWSLHDVIEKEGGERRFNHPTLGQLAYRQVNLRVANRPELKLVMLLPD
ncbi:helix-turn-helix domain protein [Collimonas arenae]|uniref:Helix-turn-helix domain protein n=1 Tax=Collimonas arenae TaxID=279058 RepID=A0A127QGE8_9BURK|nr:helix-turn-helix transcriptional regulator [Collimonas arenae]AMO99233.1 helix-turn-helix domain protein [Collimonas arenae]AMP09130.1 helix-turn-helix domain protein [Collimonas arenae]